MDLHTVYIYYFPSSIKALHISIIKVNYNEILTCNRCDTKYLFVIKISFPIYHLNCTPAVISGVSFSLQHGDYEVVCQVPKIAPR